MGESHHKKSSDKNGTTGCFKGFVFGMVVAIVCMMMMGQLTRVHTEDGSSVMPSKLDGTLAQLHLRERVDALIHGGAEEAVGSDAVRGSAATEATAHSAATAAATSATPLRDVAVRRASLLGTNQQRTQKSGQQDKATASAAAAAAAGLGAPATAATAPALTDGPAVAGSGSRMSRTQCSFKYGKREFLSDEQRRLPPMLYTFPGSGNTWCRLLIEYGTGVLTGAVYNDKTLLEALPGEFKCNWKVSAVKVHPHTHDFEGLRTGTFSSDDNKCKQGGVKRFERAILLIRNPFDSIWSEYQRRVSQSHVAGVPKRTFNWHRWQANAANLAHKYHEMWAVHHAGIDRHFGKTAEEAKQNILYVRYEDLKSPERRVAALRSIVEFLRLSPNPPSASELRQRLECAFVLAENRQAHRQADASTFMTKAEAYTRPLACRMWALFGEYAARHNYGPWAGYNCSADETNGGAPFPKIPKVNVGPRGEYNKKWVASGGQKMDFGGYNRSAYIIGDDALTNSKARGPRKRPSGMGGKYATKKTGQAAAASTPQAAGGVMQTTAASAATKVAGARKVVHDGIAGGSANNGVTSGAQTSPSTAAAGASSGGGGGSSSGGSSGGMTLQQASKFTSGGKEAVGASGPAWKKN